MPRTAGPVGMVAAGREHHMVPADLEADTGRVDTAQAVVDEEDIQAAQSPAEADNSHAAAVDEGAADEEAVDKEAVQEEGLDNIHSLAGVPVPVEKVVLDRNLVDGDSSFS